MEINPELVEDTNYTDSDRTIFNALKDALQDSANPQASAKVADAINAICGSAQGDEILPDIWSVIIDIARCIPPGHPYQDSLVRSLDELRGQDGAVEVR